MFSLLNFAISLIAVAAVIAFFQIPLTWNILLLPLLLFYIFLFCLGLGLLLSSLAVFFRDVMHLWGVVLTAWTYATPLFYPTSILTDWMWTIMQFNPHVLLRHLFPRHRPQRRDAEPGSECHLPRLRRRHPRHRVRRVPQAAEEIHPVRIETKVRYA